MHIKRLTIKNFRLYKGEYNFDFSNKKMIIISGANGNGKSTLFDAIEWCITGVISRYQGSSEKGEFDYISHEGDLEDIMVELVLGDELDSYKIRRIETPGNNESFSGSKKEVYINDKRYSLKRGNELIMRSLIKENMTKVFHDLKGFRQFFSATQILSQDELSDFINEKKPTERYKAIETILGLGESGIGLQNYIKEKKITLENNIDNIDKDIEHISLNLSQLEQNKNNILFKIDTEKEYTLNQKIYTKEEIISILKEKIKYESNSTDYDVVDINDIKVNLSESQNSIKSDIERDNEHVETLTELKNKISIIDLDRIHKNKYFEEQIKIKEQKYNNTKELRVNQEKELNKVEHIYKLKNQYDEIKKEIDGVNVQLETITSEKNLLENTLKEKTLNYNGQVIEYENEINKHKSVCDNYLLKQKIIKLSDEIIEKQRNKNEIELKLEDTNKQIEANNNKYNQLTSKLKKNEEAKENKSNIYESLVLDLQNQLIEKKDVKECPICGTSFLSNNDFVSAIKKCVKAIEQQVGLEKKVYLEQVNEIKNIEVLISELKQRQNSLKESNNTISLEIKAKNDELIRLKSEKTMDFNGIDELYIYSNDFYKENQKFVTYLELWHMKNSAINNLISTKNKLSKKCETLIQSTPYKELLLNTENLDDKCYSVKGEINTLSEKEATLKTELSNLKEEYIICKNELSKYNALILEIKKYISTFEGNIKELDKYMEDINIDIVNKKELLVNYNKCLEIVNSYISNNKINKLYKQLEELNGIKDKESQKKKALEEEKKSTEQGMKALDIAIEQAINTQSSIITKYMDFYSDDVNKLFLQVSPHRYRNNIAIFVKDKNLYFLISDKKVDAEEYKDLSENELRRIANASLTLSSAQANILAVCIFIVMNMTQDCSKLNFLGIDDPFQNMDDLNIYSFIDVISNLISNRQIMISTHDSNFARLLGVKSNLEQESIGSIVIEGYSQNCVEIRGNCIIADDSNESLI